MKVNEILNEVVSAEEMAAMKAKSDEQRKKLGGLKAKLLKAKVRGQGTDKGFDNSSRGRLRGRGRGTAAADQSMIQK